MPNLNETSDKRSNVELFCLGLIVLLGIAAIYVNFFTGSQAFIYNIGDMGSDTIEAYVPFYLNLIQQFNAGTLSLWNFEYELGVSSFSYQSWMYDPFNIVTVLLGFILGESQLALILVVNQSLKIILSAFLFSHFLTFYCKKPLSRILGSTLYAFSGFILLNGQHYWLGSAFVLFTFVMLSIELYLKKKSVGHFALITISVLLLAAWSPYIAFMALLFAFIYVLFRIGHTLSVLTPKSYILELGKLAVPVICGILLACFNLIPYAYFLSGETARITGGPSLSEKVLSHVTSLINLDWIPAMLSRFLGSGLLNNGAVGYSELVSPVADIGFEGSFTYEFVLLGFSGIAFLVLSQFIDWTIRDADKRDRKLIIGASFLLLFYFVDQFLPTLFNGMALLSYRSSFVLALPICCAIAVGWDKRFAEGTVAKWPLIIAALLTVAVLIWSLLNSVNTRTLCLYYLCAAVLCVAFMVLISKKRATAVATALILFLAVSMSAADGFYCTNLRGYVVGSEAPLSSGNNYGDATKKAIEYVKSRDSSFYRLDKTYAVWSPLNDSLIGRYDGASAYNSTADADIVQFYEQLWSESVSTWAVYSRGFVNAPNSPEIASLLNIKYILTYTSFDVPWCVLETEIDDVKIYRNTLADSIATVKSSVVSESSARALPNAAARRELLATSIIVSDEKAAELSDSLTGATVLAQSSFSKTDDSHIYGTIETNETSVACVSVPNTATWTVTVDGQNVDTFRADYGFIGFRLDPGVHSIEMSYRPNMQDEGIVLSLVGLSATIVSCIVLVIKRKKEKIEKSAA